jgi:hypothetical protein
MDETLGFVVALKSGVPTYQVEDDKGESIYEFIPQPPSLHYFHLALAPQRFLFHQEKKDIGDH